MKTLLHYRRPLTLAGCMDAFTAVENAFLRNRLEVLRRWIDQPDRAHRFQQFDRGLPGEGGIDNLPGPAPRQPEPDGCLTALPRLFSRLGRKR
jgi:hypothetical protein